ncbi:MAG TPA: ABC transporter ATP-binding protein [Clostridiaceae bacterium]|nr:ABC transporter ATP-binding protein [Clostridiaceae bacterium]
MALLDVRNITIEYKTESGLLRAVDDVSFTLNDGESLGLVGESGCGKTTLAKSIMRLLAKNGRISEGQMIFKGEDLITKSDDDIRRLRLDEIAMVSQSAMNALNPVHTVGKQLIEGIQAHSKASKREAYQRAVDVFRMVGLEAKRLRAYPHQMSGGMKQRAIIAMALTLNPSLIIADEPTTALDVVVQDHILQQIIRLKKEINGAMILITHDISVVSETCDSIIVMYGGKIMEQAPTSVYFRNPTHPYSLGLKNAFPSITEIGEELISIPGTPPDLHQEQPGCRFSARCPFATPKCEAEVPQLEMIGENHRSACHYNDDVERFRAESKKPETWQAVRERIAQAAAKASDLNG